MELVNRKTLIQVLLIVLPAIVGLILVLQSLATLAEWLCYAIQSSDLDYAERWLAYIAQQSFPGGNHLTSAYQLPYNASPYPPLSYLIHGGLGRLFGGELLTVRTVGRFTALGMTLLSSGLIVLVSQALGSGRLWGVGAGLIFLIARPAHFFAVSLRPDEMACTIMLIGLVTVLSFRNYWLAGTIFAVALTAKHSFIAVPLAIVIQLLLKRDIRSSLKFIVGGSVAGLVIALLSTWMLGPYWWQAFTLQGLHGGDPKQAIFFIGDGFTQLALIVGLASLLVSELSGTISVVALAFIISLLLNSIALMKVGAASNYFLETVALGAILSGHLAKQIFDRQIQSLEALRWKQFSWALLLALLIPGTVTQMIETIHTAKALQDAVPSFALVERLQAIEAPILSDSAGFYFDSQHTPYVTPPDLIMAAVEGGKMDGSPMQEFIERQEFGAVVLKTNWKERRFYPQAWISAIEQNYENAGVIDGFFLMLPKS